MGSHHAPRGTGWQRKQACGKMTGLARDKLSFRDVLGEESRWTGVLVAPELSREAWDRKTG